jgi:hypothetical protein
MAKRYSRQFEIGAEAKRVTLVGRFAQTLERLIAAGPKGITALDHPGTRLSHYVWKLRHEHGLTISADDEKHGGEFAGHHARYRLETPTRVVAEHSLARELASALDMMRAAQ